MTVVWLHPGTARGPARRDTSPLTPLDRASKQYRATFTAPTRGDGVTKRELWSAMSTDGVWAYVRVDDDGTPWMGIFRPTGQYRCYGTISEARRATAATNGAPTPGDPQGHLRLVQELRMEASAALAAPDPDTRLKAVRWTAVHMRMATTGGYDDILRCACGGLLVHIDIPSRGRRTVHLDGCPDCAPHLDQTTLCEFAAVHQFCEQPTPVACTHAGTTGCAGNAHPVGIGACPLGEADCCGQCCGAGDADRAPGPLQPGPRVRIDPDGRVRVEQYLA